MYNAGTSKAELLNMVVDHAVAGDDQEVLISDRPPVAALAEEADPRRQVAMIAELIADTQERSAPIHRALRQAAAIDEAAAATLAAQLERRRQTLAAAVDLVPADALRYAADDTVDTLATVGSTEVFLLLRDARGWHAREYAAWLTRTLVDALLRP